MQKKLHILTLSLLVIVLVSGLMLFFIWYRSTRVSPECLAEFDLLITGAEIIDGSGRPPFYADIGISNKRIVCIGDLRGAKGRTVVDAHGLTLAPGFIDVHTHVERNVPQAAPFLAPNFIRQGVTTLITGNCGRSALEVGKFFNQLETHGTQVNLATLIGHNTVRLHVMKQKATVPTATELAEMENLVRRGMLDGALGLSTGLVYIPGTFAKTDEITSLAKVVAKENGLYVSHIRDEGSRGVAALQEAIAIGAAAGAHVHISHFKAQGPNEWGSARARLALLDAARERGIVVSLDQYPYSASSTGLAVLLPAWLSEGDFTTAKRKLQDPATHRRIRNEMLDQLRTNGWTDYSFARIAYYQFDPSLVGMSVAEVTEKRAARTLASHAGLVRSKFVSTKEERPADRGAESDPERQAETIMDLFSHGGAQMVFFDMSEDDVQNIMRNPRVMFGSDSSVREDNPTVLPHPRGTGTFPRVLGVYARQKNLFSIEEAIRRMTSLPAETFGLKGRGLIRENNWADLVIFDRNQILDTATFEKPFSIPQGIHYVIVNGSIVLDQQNLTKALPGMALRRNTNEALTYDWESSSPSLQIIKTASDAGSTVILTTAGVNPKLTAVPIKVSLIVSDGNGGAVTGHVITLRLAAAPTPTISPSPSPASTEVRDH
jgi:N-acyl-D-amino-acid deacylase